MSASQIFVNVRTELLTGLLCDCPIVRTDIIEQGRTVVRDGTDTWQMGARSELQWRAFSVRRTKVLTLTLSDRAILGTDIIKRRWPVIRGCMDA